MVARIAASHIRVGTFQFFAQRGEIDKLRALTEYSIARHDPDLTGPERYLAFLHRVIARQMALVAIVQTGTKDRAASNLMRSPYSAGIIVWSTDGSTEWIKPWTWFSAARWGRIGDTL